MAPTNTTHIRRIIHVRKVYYDELEPYRGYSCWNLNEMRSANLKKVFEMFGEVEEYEHNWADNYVLVTFVESEAANDALKALRNRNTVDEILDEIYKHLKVSKEPRSTCPRLQKYNFEWSRFRKPSKTAEQPQAEVVAQS
jgi:hypothetical protein